MITNEQLAKIRAEQEDAAKAAIEKDREESGAGQEAEGEAGEPELHPNQAQGVGRPSKTDEGRRERGPVSTHSWRSIWGLMALWRQAAGHWRKHSKSGNAQCLDTSRRSWR